MKKSKQSARPVHVAFLQSFSFAFQGIFFCLKTQHNARLHLISTILVLSAGAALKISPADWRWLTVCIALVWFAELMNTAFEYLCDVISPQFHHAVKRAKDIAAGAVLVCALAACVIGIITFLPYLQS